MSDRARTSTLESVQNVRSRTEGGQARLGPTLPVTRPGARDRVPPPSDPTSRYALTLRIEGAEAACARTCQSTSDVDVCALSRETYAYVSSKKGREQNVHGGRVLSDWLSLSHRSMKS